MRLAQFSHNEHPCDVRLRETCLFSQITPSCAPVNEIDDVDLLVKSATANFNALTRHPHLPQEGHALSFKIAAASPHSKRESHSRSLGATFCNPGYSTTASQR